MNGKRNFNIKREINENFNSKNDSYYNNVSNENSKGDSNLESGRDTTGHSCMKTDINDSYLETMNDNIKSILPNKNFFDKKLIIKNDKRYF